MKAEDIKTLNVDDVPYTVDELPEELRELVDIFNTWNKDEVDARLNLLKVQSAKRDLSRTIIQKVRKMKEDEVAANSEADGADSGEPDKGEDTTD